MILWSIASDVFQGYASGSVGMIQVGEINNKTAVVIGGKSGLDSLTNANSSFKSMFETNCVSTGCTLKFSLVRPLQLSSPVGTNSPYLEYQVSIGGTKAVPNQYATITVQANLFGFAQTIIQHIRQRTSLTGTEFATIN